MTIRMWLVVSVTLTIVFVVTYVAQGAFHAWRLKSGPHAWFAVQRFINRQTVMTGNDGKRVVAGPFASKANCVAWVRSDQVVNALTGCEELLLTDAARMR